MENDEKSILSLSNKEGFVRYIFKNKTESIMKDSALSFIRSNWEYIAGNLSMHTWPVKYAGKKLTVRVEKSVYAQELNMYMNWIMDRLRELKIQVDSIKVESGPLKGFFSSSTGNQRKNLSDNSDNKRDLTDAQKNFLSGLEKWTS